MGSRELGFLDDCVLNIRAGAANHQSIKMAFSSEPPARAAASSHHEIHSDCNSKTTEKSISHTFINASKVNLKPPLKPKLKDVRFIQTTPRAASSTSNSLQFSCKKPRGKPSLLRTSKENVNNTQLEKLMSDVVEPRIEPVFSNTLWSEFCKQFNIHPHILSCILDRFNLKRLTAIQQIAIPLLINDKDCLIRAQTGSGKTLAYAVPVFNQLMVLEPPVTRNNGPLALVVLPTRELATQTFEVFQLLGHACVRIVPGCLIGGFKRKRQKVSLRKGLNIVIGTPQRILDHILRTVSLNLKNLRYLVIDEADRLLEMGFEQSVRHIVDHIQTVTMDSSVSASGALSTILLSATLTPGVEKLAGLALRNPVRCIVRETEVTFSNCHSKQSSTLVQSESSIDQFAMPVGLKHFILVVPWKLRLVSLAAFLLLKCRYHKKAGKLVVFMATQDCVDFHYYLFKTILCPDEEDDIVPEHATHLCLFRLHGSMEHSEREFVFHEFATSHAGILVTTDVASRGLDLAGVAWVVQYHVTGGPVDYVHRVGRTARAGGRGKAVLFLEQQEVDFVDLLRQRAGVVLEPLNLADLMQTALFHVRNVKRRGKFKPIECATVEEGVSRFSHLLLNAVAEDETLTSLAETAYTSFLRSYASFSGDLRKFFTFKKLHLGHVARAFCLQATPKDVASRVTGRHFPNTKDAHLKSPKIAKRRSCDSSDEEPSVIKRSFALAFDPKRPKKCTRLKIKPWDLARRNMLAEFGL